MGRLPVLKMCYNPLPLVVNCFFPSLQHKVLKMFTEMFTVWKHRMFNVIGNLKLDVNMMATISLYIAYERRGIGRIYTTELI